MMKARRILVASLALAGATVALAQDRERPFRATLRFGRPGACVVASCVPAGKIHVAPDGRTATLVDRHESGLVDLETGRVVKTLKHDDMEGQSDLAIAPDGRRGLSVGDHRIVFAHEDVFTSWAPARAIEMGSLVDGLGFSSDGALAIVSMGDEVTVHDAGTLAIRASIRLEGMERKVCALSAERFIVGTLVGKRRLVDLSREQGLRLSDDLASLEVHEIAAVSSTRVATISKRRTLTIHDLATGEHVDALVSAYSALTVAPGGSFVLAADRGDVVHVFNSESGGEVGDLRFENERVESIACTASGLLLARTASRKIVKLDLAAATKDLDPDCHRSGVTAIAASAGGALVVTGGVDRTVRLWDGKTGRQRRVLVGHKSVVVALALDGKTLTSRDWSDTEITWDLETGREVARRSASPRAGDRVALLRARWLVADAASLRIEREDGTTEAVLGERGYSFVARHPDGVHAIAVGGGIEVWDLEKKKRERRLDEVVGHPFALSPDGSLLVSEGRRVWWLDGGWVVATLPETVTPASAVLWLDDRTLIVGDRSGGLVRYER